MRSQTFEEHLTEFQHVLNQLSVAGAKFAFSKGQWCRTKVEYVGLTVGANGIKHRDKTSKLQQVCRNSEAFWVSVTTHNSSLRTMQR